MAPWVGAATCTSMLLRRLRCGTLAGAEGDGLDLMEAAAVRALAQAHQELLLLLPLEPSEQEAAALIIDSQSEAGQVACTKFLACLEACAQIMRIEVAPRTYRAGFSVNYRALFPDGSRHYRLDVLEASIDRFQAIWANGDKFELSPEAVGHAEELQQSMLALGQLLLRWSELRPAEEDQAATCPGQEAACRRPLRAALVVALRAVDIAWASFEHRYIANLIAIEDQARRLVVRAVEAEERLAALERRMGRGSSRQELGDMTEIILRYREAQAELVECLGKLNAVANHDGKGRDDLTMDVLERAATVADVGRQDANADHNYGTVQVLASDVLGSFGAMRRYLREVKACLERVDPHLCNNAGLVVRLVDWEECWEAGGRYIKDAALLPVLCDVLANIKDIQRLSPRLSTMCADCDAEVFMVLPRIALLSFLVQPCIGRAALLRMMMPTRFQQSAAGSEAGLPHPELQQLADDFQQVACWLASEAQPLFAVTGETQGSAFDAARAFSHEVLVRRAVEGSSEGWRSLLQQLPVASQDLAREAVDRFSRGLERWSVELQRSCPEDWNQCSAVLLQCISGHSKLRRQAVAFQV